MSATHSTGSHLSKMSLTVILASKPFNVFLLIPPSHDRQNHRIYFPRGFHFNFRNFSSVDLASNSLDKLHLPLKKPRSEIQSLLRFLELPQLP